MVDSRERRLVLIVEDCVDNREMYSMSLVRRGMDVLEAGDAHTGIELALSRSPDVILMDLSLPDMDGLRAIDVLKSNPRTRALPIIVLSGDSSVYELGSAGPWDHFVRKPCLPDDLVAVIKRVLAARAAPAS